MLARCSRQAARRLYQHASRISFGGSTAAEAEACTDRNVESSATQLPSTGSKHDQVGVRKLSFPSKPQSLSLPLDSRLRVEDIDAKGWKRFLLNFMLYYHPKSKMARGAGTLHSRITAHVDNPALYASTHLNSAFGLEKTFRTTYSMLVLHMWLCLVRLRSEGKEGKAFSQVLYEVYNEDLAKRVVGAGVKMHFSKWMKELEKMFYGNALAYDKAMQPEASKGDLAKALWRNVFSEDGSPMPTGEQAIPVQALVRYVRRVAASLVLTDKESILSGNILFGADEFEEKIKEKVASVTYMELESLHSGFPSEEIKDKANRMEDMKGKANRRK